MKLYSKKTGILDSPLHYGKTPRWLFEKMVELARAMIEVIVLDFGRKEFIKRISDPLWFQAFGCLLGFDWHSSGLTTTVCGAIKQALLPTKKDIKLFACGGKGSTSRKTPLEIVEIGESIGIKESIIEKIKYASKMAAKVDSSLVQDGYVLYHHVIFFTNEGEWAVVQQGMNTSNRYARRYHWLSENVKEFVVEPHTAICCNKRGKTLNLVDKTIDNTRQVITHLSREHPAKTVKEIIKLPVEHSISLRGIRRIEKTLLKTYENPPKDFTDLIGIEGVGAQTIRALSLVANLCYGTALSWKDPALYSFAHGGKDGTPYPIDRKTYINTIETLKTILAEARIGLFDKKRAFERLQHSFPL